MKLRLPSEYSLIGDLNNGLRLKSKDTELIIQPIDRNVVRVTHVPKGANYRNTANPVLKGAVLNESCSQIEYNLPDGLMLKINRKDGAVSWYPTLSAPVPFLQDLPIRAYEHDLHSGAHHYTCYRPDNYYYGMGEHSSPLRLNSKTFPLKCIDALGYEAELTNTMYKHTPMYISLDENGGCYGVLYTTKCEGEIGFGGEIDGIWGPYVHFRSASPVLEYFVIFGNVKDVIRNIAKLVGCPARVPKYALGYLASSMGYAENEDAQRLIEEFPELCRENKIPCDVMHLSSGYTYTNDQRNVFTWNTSRFPDAASMFKNLASRGIRCVVNVKPWLLVSHPMYETLAKQGGFIHDPEVLQ